jgi:hypothetical protein
VQVYEDIWTTPLGWQVREEDVRLLSCRRRRPNGCDEPSSQLEAVSLMWTMLGNGQLRVTTGKESPLFFCIAANAEFLVTVDEAECTVFVRKGQDIAPNGLLGAIESQQKRLSIISLISAGSLTQADA